MAFNNSNFKMARIEKILFSTDSIRFAIRYCQPSASGPAPTQVRPHLPTQRSNHLTWPWLVYMKAQKQFATRKKVFVPVL
jgi:hypothetical protein